MNDNLNQRLILIAPTTPRGICGVSDYSYQTAQVLSKFYASVDIGVQRVPAPPVGDTTGTLSIGSWRQIVARSMASAQPHDLLLNYTPASYAWSCLPVSLLLTLRRFKKAHPENHVFVFVHEAWNGSTKLRLHQIIRNRFARWSINRIGKMAGGIAVVTEGQKKDLGRLLGKTDIYLSLVGANILPKHKNAGLTSSRQPGVWVVFGLAHSRLWTLQAFMPFLKAMHAQGALVQIQSIGPIDTNYSRQETALIAQAFGSTILLQLGVLPPAEVSDRLLVAQAALVKQDADSLRKSGSFAALTAHAVPIVCDVASTLEEPPGSAIFRSAEVIDNPAILLNEENDWRRRRLHEWFWSTRSWDRIGESMRNWMTTPTQPFLSKLPNQSMTTTSTK